MTITITVQRDAEMRLRAEADREGVLVEQLVERVVAERIEALSLNRKERAQEFFDKIARPGPIVDVTRDGIHADI